MLAKAVLSIASMAEAVSALENATIDLQALTRTTENEIRSVARVFESLAGHTNTILTLAAAIVGCVESEDINSVLPKAQMLGVAARSFIADRLEATEGILKTVTTEVDLLRQLSQVSCDQEEIAVQIKALSVLTNIEVAHLGSVGVGFQYLANELADFSKSMIADTQELAMHSENRRRAIDETRRVLSAELPRQREQLARIEADLGAALSIVESGLTELSRTPSQFRICVEDVSRQIAGVVAAIQAHDITRQQIEHVQHAFGLITERMCSPRNFATDSKTGDEDERELSEAYAGLTIQIYQLKTIKETVASWASQIRTCMKDILAVSASAVVGIGPAVIEQEREVSSQLARIELLEREGQTYSARIERNLGGLSNLMQLVSEHVQRSKSIRDRLRLLTFNSIIEASHLGSQANAILAIARSIKEVSAEWNRITGQSAHAMEEMVNVVTKTGEAAKTFSAAGNERLRNAQTQTAECLDNLRRAAASASRHAQAMSAATEKMQAKVAGIGQAGEHLDSCFAPIDEVVSQLDDVQHYLESVQPCLKDRCDAAGVEQLFSASYTTEMERHVLRAALHGTALPMPQATFAGNSVELF